MRFTYKSVLPSIFIQMIDQTSLKDTSQKMWPKWPPFGPKQASPTLARALRMVIGHNFAIFHPILTNKYTKMTSSPLLQIYIFGPHFCSEASHGQCCTHGVKTTLKLLVHVLAFTARTCNMDETNKKLITGQP